MSLNKVVAEGGRLTLHGDYVVKHCGDVEFSLEGDRVPTHMKGTKKGDAFLTTKLVKQPIFGANAITGFVLSEHMGGWDGNANFKFSFTTGGAIEFAESLKRAVVQAQRAPAAPPPAPVGGYYATQPPGGYPYAPQPGYPMQGAGYYPAPGMAYAPQGPPHGAPAQGQAPPPYQAEYYPKSDTVTDAKAREAYSSGQNVYIPNANETPPPYNPNYHKKTQ